jgi:hypothetical protein
MSSRVNRGPRKQPYYTSKDSYTVTGMGKGHSAGSADQDGKKHGDGEGFRRGPKPTKSSSKGR